MARTRVAEVSAHASPFCAMAEEMELWHLRTRYSDYRCMRWPLGVGWELRIYQDADLVVQELFPSEDLLLLRAQELQKVMQRRGWNVVKKAN